MKNYITVLALSLTAFGSAHADVGCIPHENFDSFDFAGEVYGDTGFEAVSGIRKFALEREGGGWQIKVFDASGPEIPVKRLPSGIPQPDMTFIQAADYLSADKTQTIQGPVIRKFMHGRSAVDSISNPELLVPGQPMNGLTVEPSEGDHGIGELIVEDIGIADIGPDKTPRLTYLKFSGCLGWDKGYQQPGEADIGKTYSGYYRQGFEQSDFYTEDGQGPFWVTADDPVWSELQSHYVEGPGRGGGVTVKLTAEGTVAVGGGFGSLGNYNEELTITNIIDIDPITTEDFWDITSRFSANMNEDK